MKRAQFFWKVLVAPVLAIALALTLASCGGDKKPANSPSAPDNGMDDAFALLPGNAIAVGTVDARAFVGSKTFGAELARLIDRYVPFGAEAGFQATRDVDRVVFASYSYQGMDVAAVLVGRFDPERIRQAAAQRSPMQGGAVLVASQYAGRDVYTANNVGFTVLSNTKVIAGTESGIRRVLERIKDGRVQRDVPPWMLQTLETPGSAAAIAGDFGSQPVPAEAIRRVPVGFARTMKALRVLVSFKDPGLQLAGSMTYGDEAGAVEASGQVKQLIGMSKLLALFGIRLQNVDIKTEKQDVQVRLEVDDQSLRQLLSAAPQWLGQ
jgi:hypothetical protein